MCTHPKQGSAHSSFGSSKGIKFKIYTNLAFVVDTRLAFGTIRVLHTLHLNALDPPVSGPPWWAGANGLVVADIASGSRATELGARIYTAAVLTDSGFRAVQVGDAFSLGLAAG